MTSCKGGKDLKEKELKHAVEDEYKKNFHLGILEKMRGNYDLAEGHFEKCLSINQSSDAAHYALSDLHQMMGHPDKELSHAQAAYEIDNENKWYIIKLGELYYNKGDYHKSADFLSKIIEDEKNLDIKFRYAESLIHSNQFKKAIAMLDEIEVETGKSPNLSLTKHDLYLQLKDEESAANELQSLIDDSPNNIENRLVIADYFLKTNQKDKAEKALKDILITHPKSGEALLMMADIKLRDSDLESSFEYLEKGFAEDDVIMSRKIALIQGLEPYAFNENEDAAQIKTGLEKLYSIIYDEDLKNDTMHYAYGIFLRESGEQRKAAKQFKIVTDINPGNYNSWRQLLFINYQLEDYEEMRVYGEKAIDVYPSQPEVYLLTGIGARETGKFETAEEWLFLGKDLVVNDDPLKAEFFHQMGKNSAMSKDFDQAFKSFDEAQKLDPYNGNLYASKANTQLETGDKDGAIKTLENALAESPTNSYLLDAMGTIHFKSEGFESAKKYFENALIYEKDPMFIEHLGDALFKLGETEKSFEKWQEAKNAGRDTKLLNKKLTDKTYYAE
ncbi:MAG: hypothetical protein BM555_00655 [Crocinitomix sp. MedPE-SWsnd]|nr:MAG: hypothetical protein BM555_00655 [Crocinitomix sp. MedPE-SWsnd]